MLSSALSRSSAAAARSLSSASSTLACVATPSSSSFPGAKRGMAGMAGRDVRMRVILNESSKLGLQGDVVSVKRGYGRNVLVRQGKAVYATAENLYLANVEKLRQAAAKQQAQPTTQEVTEENTKPDASTSGAGASTSGQNFSEDNLRYQLDLAHRLTTQRAPIFYRAANAPAPLVTPRDVYIKLGRLFPSLTLSQITLAGGQPISKVGEYTAEVALPGLAKPTTFKVLVKKLEDRRTAAAAIPTPQFVAPAKPKAASQSIKA